MSKNLADYRHELDHAHKQIAALRRENELLKLQNTNSEVPSPQEQVEPTNLKKKMDTLTKATIWLAIGTFASILVIGYGTYLTIHSEEENKFLPILALGSQDDYTDPAHPAHTLVIRNIGFGPALNSVTKELHIGGKILLLNHRTAIASTDTEDIDGEETTSGKAPFSTITSLVGNPVAKRVTLIKAIEDEIGNAEVNVCTQYENAHGEQYETWCRFQTSNFTSFSKNRI